MFGGSRGTPDVGARKSSERRRYLVCESHAGVFVSGCGSSQEKAGNLYRVLQLTTAPKADRGSGPEVEEVGVWGWVGRELRGGAGRKGPGDVRGVSLPCQPARNSPWGQSAVII